MKDGWLELYIPGAARSETHRYSSPGQRRIQGCGCCCNTSAVLDWGDGTSSEGVIVESGGEGVASFEHIYTETGVYELKLTMMDAPYLAKYEEIYQYIVIYDPRPALSPAAGGYSPRLALMFPTQH